MSSQNIHSNKITTIDSRAIANNLPKAKEEKEPVTQFEDNRPQAIAQRKLQEMADNSQQVQKLKAVQQLANNGTQITQNISPQKNTHESQLPILPSASNAIKTIHGPGVIQKVRKKIKLRRVEAKKGKNKNGKPGGKIKWPIKKYDRFFKYLQQRAAMRVKKGKNKSGHKLARKLIKARRRVDPNFQPRLADAPTAGHHAPPLALSNKQNQGFQFGKRGSAQEMERDRLYFEGTPQEREEAHYMAHASESIQGVNRQGTFNGNAQELAAAMARAHTGLTLGNHQPIRATVKSQKPKKANNKKVKPPQDLGDATTEIMKNQLPGVKLPKVDIDSASSSVDSDEDNWSVDSDE